MGYEIKTTDCNVEITKENFKLALELINSLGVVDWAVYVDTKGLSDANALVTEFQAIRYSMSISHDQKGKPSRVILEYFTGEYLGEEAKIWSTLSPAVTPGGFINWVGEEGTAWRYEFDGEKMLEKSGVTIWEGDDG